MTGQEAALRLAEQLRTAKKERECTAIQWLSALLMFDFCAGQWLRNGKDIGEDQYNNVWAVISRGWSQEAP